MPQRLILVLFVFFAACHQDPSIQNKNNQPVYSQQEIMQTMIPVIKSEGQVFRKFKKVYARQAEEGEKIQTITADGLETTNQAEAGDFIIKNQTEAGEMYIIGAGKFHERYDFLEQADDSFSVYAAKGKVKAMEMNEAILQKLNLSEEFHFVAPWGEKMIVKKGDYLASPLDFSEVYRIARKEFFETFQPDK